MGSEFKVVDGHSFLQQQKHTKPPVDAETLLSASKIVCAVRDEGEPALRRLAEKFSERTADDALIYGPAEMRTAYERISKDDQALLNRVAERIRSFAKSQLECLTPLSSEVDGGKAGHTIEPISRVGCYAPGGRYPLPSTVLMTTVTARTAGCREVVLASPNPTDMTLAAGHVGGADQMLPIGGAHAIAALAYGFEGFERTDLICGPGNRWVTAAKQLVVGSVGIDMLAGPSELLIVADDESNPQTVAADLLAQAEHDVDARPFLVCLSEAFANTVIEELRVQLSELPTGKVAELALQNGCAIVVQDREQAQEVCTRLAPEHLELHLEEAQAFAEQVKHAGCIFVGSQSAEVLGDYGAGPNHTLPTGGTARWSAGLNVFTFVRVRTWLQLNNPSEALVNDTVALARHEGLVGHARSASRRMPNV
jgi:phosphoribosyl-ATP pyrophosphohydrolase/phosphoribosyl-AMP cyclohydrolase/histidinol dehydrogenase